MTSACKMNIILNLFKKKNIKQFNKIELFENDKINLYRKTNIAITTPIIIKTHAQTNPPIVIGN